MLTVTADFTFITRRHGMLCFLMAGDACGGEHFLKTVVRFRGLEITFELTDAPDDRALGQSYRRQMPNQIFLNYSAAIFRNIVEVWVVHLI
jgi:hypothetical protein